jgi:hypothetical protein
MYANGNPKTKKQLREWIKSGKLIEAFQAGGMFPGTTNGRDMIEGPQFPAAHKWYASVEIKNGLIVKVLS